jgi:hypothetical protein
LGKSPQQAETENPPSGGIFCFVAFLIKKALLAKECLVTVTPWIKPCQRLINVNIIVLSLNNILSIMNKKVIDKQQKKCYTDTS